MTRSETPIWGAASPTPLASRMLSIMSSMSRWMDASILGTRFACSRSTGSPSSIVWS